MTEPMAQQGLDDALALGPGSCVAFIGAGGKTTSILALANVAVASRLKVIVTTTTKIWPPAAMSLVVPRTECDLVEAVRLELQHEYCVAVGQRVTGAGKVEGLDPRLLCHLVESEVADVVLCEADGAAGRSLKVHGRGEPVVPNCATAVVVVAGMDAIGQPGGEVIHRFDAYQTLTQVERDVRITPALCADILSRAATTLNSSVTCIFLLNKVDNSGRKAAAELVAAELRLRRPDAPVVMSCYRSIVPGTIET